MQSEFVYKKLQEFKISYQLIEHKPVFTTKEANTFVNDKNVIRTKTLFLCDHKSRSFFMIISDDQKQLNMAKIAPKLDIKRPKFASPDNLMKKLAVTPGSVSLFGLLNNHEQDVKVFIDKDIDASNQSLISFHPNDNSKTVFISVKDMYKFLKKSEFDYQIIELS